MNDTMSYLNDTMSYRSFGLPGLFQDRKKQDVFSEAYRDVFTAVLKQTGQIGARATKHTLVHE